MRYFSFDVETDGLFGECFAVAAVVMDEQEQILASFSGKSMEMGIESSWVKENCLPYLTNLPDYPSRYALTEAFWAFYTMHQHNCVILVDAPFPVESRLLRQCIDRKIEERQALSPYPLIDVMSMLFACGLDPMTSRMQLAGMEGKPHNPLTDAIASAKCAIRLKKQNGLHP